MSNATMESFAEASSAFIGGAFSCAALYPLDVVKTTQQRGSTLTAAEILKKAIEERGVVGLWNGCTFKAQRLHTPPGTPLMPTGASPIVANEDCSEQ